MVRFIHFTWIFLIYFITPETHAQSATAAWHSVMLDSDSKASFTWTVESSTEMHFRMTYKTKGYAALGFSLTGTMKGADIFLVYVTPEGRVVTNDCYATANTFPRIDDAPSNYNVKLAMFNGTHVTIEASRPYNSCDQQDVAITNDTMRLLWALDDSPVDDFSQLNKHRALNRGSRSIQLMYPQNTQEVERMRNTPSIQTIDVHVTNAPIPSAHHTLYYCQIIEVQPQPTPSQIVGFDALISPPSSNRFVHHLLLYKCKKATREHAGRAGPCYNQKPYETNRVDPLMEVLMEDCTQQMIGGWAYGGEGFAFPDDTGLNLFDANEPTYLMLEMHYDNQDYIPGQLDNSGLRLFHTPVLRPRHAIHMMLGVMTSPKDIIVPPGETGFLTTGYCPKDCTNLVNGGIEVFAGVLHTHLVGVKARLRHIRDGVELPPILADENYDFNYQNTAKLKTPIKVLPGDELITECVYDTAHKQNVTVGGKATTDEMCLAFLYGVRANQNRLSLAYRNPIW